MTCLSDNDILFIIYRTSFRPRLCPQGINFPCESPFSTPRGKNLQKSSLSATLHPLTNTHAKFQLSTTINFGCALSVSHSVTEGFYMYWLIFSKRDFKDRILSAYRRGSKYLLGTAVEVVKKQRNQEKQDCNNRKVTESGEVSWGLKLVHS